MDWNEVLSAFDRCVISVAEEPSAENGGAPAEAGEDKAEAQGSSSSSVTALNHKLIEIHSRLKALSEEACGDVTSPSSSGTDLGGTGGSNGSAANSASALGAGRSFLVPFDTSRHLVRSCMTVLRKPRKFESHSLAAQLLAELARSQEGRQACLEEEVVLALESALKEQRAAKKGSMETAVQICRILGNLCFNCNTGRQQIMRSLCLEHLLAVAENRERTQKEDPGQRFPVILPGFLLNFCTDKPEAVEAAGEAGFVRVIVDNIMSTQTNDAIFNSSLNFLVTVAEDDSGHNYLKDTPNFSEALNHILVYTTSPEVTETTLELVRGIAEDPELTLLLAQSQICDTIIKHIVGRWKCPEFEEHRSDACDLLVLILSHDSSMKHMYFAEDGKFLQTFFGWLKSDDMQLKVAASLAIGNFACSEENCVQLMENNTSHVLISLLKAHQNPNTDLKLQHALLGSLRNLAVAARARKQLLDQGLIEPCLRLSEKLSMSTAQPVIFKLLATLRLVIEGNSDAAQQIGTNRSFLAKLIEWGTTDAQALKMESARLLAALIKNSQSREVMVALVECEGLPHVTTMLTSSHVRMLNEAVVALSVLSITLPGDLVHRHLHTDLVINSIKKCLETPHIPVEVKINSLTLTTHLLRVHTDDFKQMLSDLKFAEALAVEGVKSLQEAQALQQLLTSS